MAQLFLGEKLKAIRKDRRMSQRAFAGLLSMHQSTYCRIENGQKQPVFEEISRICKVLGIPLLDMIDIDPDGPTTEGSGGRGGSNADKNSIKNAVSSLEEALKLLKLLREE